MNNDFKTLVKEKETKELLEIVGAPKKWNKKITELAHEELILRKIDPKKIKTAKYLTKKKEQITINNKANKSYHLFDFIFDPLPNFVEILFSWELQKDGFTRKAKQQKYFRYFIFITALILFGVAFILSKM